jgi:NitT/TauT family transport system substrate-binding protein
MRHLDWLRRNASPLFGVTLLALLAFVFGTPPSGPKTTRERLRLAYFPNLTHAPALAGVANGAFQLALGPNVTLEPELFNAGPEAMEALLAGEVDVAYVGPGPAVMTYLKSQGRALRIVAGACNGGAALVARSNADIGSLRDLDGKRVGVPQLGGTQDISLRHFLAQAGLAAKEKGGTVDILPSKNSDILVLLRRGDLDAAWVPEPWVSRLVHEAHATIVADERSLWPTGTFLTTVLVVRRAYLDRHPDRVQAILAAHLRTVTWLRQHPEEGRHLVNAELKRVSGKALSPTVLLEAWQRCQFTAALAPADMAQLVRASAEAGYLQPQGVNVADLLDLQPLEQASKKRD